MHNLLLIIRCAWVWQREQVCDKSTRPPPCFYPRMARAYRTALANPKITAQVPLLAGLHLHRR